MASNTPDKSAERRRKRLEKIISRLLAAVDRSIRAAEEAKLARKELDKLRREATEDAGCRNGK